MTANERLNGYLMSLPMSQRRSFIRKLVVELYITPSQISSWRYGTASIPPLYRREINRIAGKEVFEHIVD